MKILIVDDEEAIHEQLKACIPAEAIRLGNRRRCLSRRGSLSYG